MKTYRLTVTRCNGRVTERVGSWDDVFRQYLVDSERCDPVEAAIYELPKFPESEDEALLVWVNDMPEYEEMQELKD